MKTTVSTTLLSLLLFGIVASAGTKAEGMTPQHAELAVDVVISAKPKEDGYLAKFVVRDLSSGEVLALPEVEFTAASTGRVLVGPSGSTSFEATVSFDKDVRLVVYETTVRSPTRVISRQRVQLPLPAVGGG